MIKKYNLIIITLMLVGFSVSGQEEENKFFITGYIKNLNELSFVDKMEQLQWTNLFHNRFNFKYIPTDEFILRLELRNRLYYGDRVKIIPLFSNLISDNEGLIDLSWNVVDANNVVLNATIDRVLINYNKGKWDITLGRQRINWGMNLVWNPNDIFNSYNFLDFDYEERPGSDALRVQYYLSDFKKIEVAIKKGRGDDHIIAAMYKFNKWSYDIQLLSGIYQKDWVIGAGWAGNLKNAGFKGEVSYFVPVENIVKSENVLSASISLDYAFEKGMYINGSVLYNSNYNDLNNDLENFMFANVNAKNLMPFKYSGFLQLSKEFSPIISSSLSLIYSNTRQSVIAMPVINYSIANNWDLNFTGQCFFELNNYKSLGNSLFIRARYSF